MRSLAWSHQRAWGSNGCGMHAHEGIRVSSAPLRLVERVSGLAVVLALASLAGCKPFIDAMNANAERNRAVTLTIEGAVYGAGPEGENGKGWDGDVIPPGYASALVTVAGAVYPPGGRALLVPSVRKLAFRFSEDLAASVSRLFAGPDSIGEVGVFEGSQRRQKVELPKRNNNYTPEWSVSIPDVKIHRSRVVITLKDRDNWGDQLMAKIVLAERELLAAEENGGLYVVDTSNLTNGAVLRLLVTVSPQ